MKQFNEILKKPLFKVSSLNSLNVIIKIAIGLVSSKIIAVFVGPSGMAMLGNLRNFMTSLEAVGTMGFQNGLIKFVAENKDSKYNLKKIISTVFIVLMLVVLSCSVFLFFAAEYWSREIFGSETNYNFIFKALAFSLPWYIVSVLLIAIINGLGEFKKVIYITILGNLLGLFVSIVLMWELKVVGVLLAVVITPSLLLFITLYYIRKEIKLFITISFRLFDFKILKPMFSYTIMAFVTGFVGPLVLLSIRNNIIHELGIEKAGYWEAINRISNFYMLFITTLSVVYFLPKLTSAKIKSDTLKIFSEYYKIVLPIFIFGVVLVYLLRFFIVHLIFTPEFEDVVGLFFWQILGDIFKAASLVLGYQLIAKRKTIIYIATELLSFLFLYLLSYYLIQLFDIEGVVMAYAINYLIYFLLLFGLRKKIV